MHLLRNPCGQAIEVNTVTQMDMIEQSKLSELFPFFWSCKTENQDQRRKYILKEVQDIVLILSVLWIKGAQFINPSVLFLGINKSKHSSPIPEWGSNICLIDTIFLE